MKDVVVITEDATGRMVQLNTCNGTTGSSGNVSQADDQLLEVESLYCSTHCPVAEQAGWAERTSHPPLPSVVVGLTELGPNIKMLIKVNS